MLVVLGLVLLVLGLVLLVLGLVLLVLLVLLLLNVIIILITTTTTTGKSLDKSQQLSNWDIRPLSMEQMNYAALDAHVLICMISNACSGSGGGGSNVLLEGK